ncbi:hypothetical protein HK100_003662 [Physocladia obscura]|uniref:Uncharacterized protein n=1 Tax=Physocladia obscura TaxID=109957 RepID=A0AAD5XGX3_9FUNG|nr:hypothetical protein HK100_003662 [Physocladia obscura]
MACRNWEQEYKKNKKIIGEMLLTSPNAEPLLATLVLATAGAAACAGVGGALVRRQRLWAWAWRRRSAKPKSNPSRNSKPNLKPAFPLIHPSATNTNINTNNNTTTVTTATATPAAVAAAVAATAIVPFSSSLFVNTASVTASPSNALEAGPESIVDSSNDNNGRQSLHLLAVLLVAESLYALLVAVLCVLPRTLYDADINPDYEPLSISDSVAVVLAFLAYLLLLVIFSANTLFALAKFCCISNADVDWTYLPYAIPQLWGEINLQTVMLFVGLLYLVLSAIAICFLYENSFFTIIAKYEISDVESVLTFTSQPERNDNDLDVTDFNGDVDHIDGNDSEKILIFDVHNHSVAFFPAISVEGDIQKKPTSSLPVTIPFPLPPQESAHIEWQQQQQKRRLEPSTSTFDLIPLPPRLDQVGAKDVNIKRSLRSHEINENIILDNDTEVENQNIRRTSISLKETDIYDDNPVRREHWALMKHAIVASAFVAFHVPSIVSVFVAIFVVGVADDSALLASLRCLPALGTLCAPIAVLVGIEEAREAVWCDCLALARVCRIVRSTNGNDISDCGGSVARKQKQSNSNYWADGSINVYPSSNSVQKYYGKFSIRVFRKTQALQMSNNSSLGEFELLFDSSHSGAGIAVIGAMLNACVLVSLVRHWRELNSKNSGNTNDNNLKNNNISESSSRTNIVFIVVVMLGVSMLHGITIGMLDEFWVQTAITEWTEDAPGVLDTLSTAIALSSLSYLLLTTLFSANLLLALERHCVVRYKHPIPRRLVIAVFVLGLCFAALFAAAFAIAPDGASWTFLPLTKPCTWDPELEVCTLSTSQAIIFSIGLSYFPLATIATCAIYENTYFLIATVFDVPPPDLVQNTSRTIDEIINNQSARNPIIQNNIKIQKAALVRCVLMSIGLVIFYLPTIALIFASIASETIALNIATNNNLVATITILPSLDPLWTPFVILAFQNDIWTVFLDDLAGIGHFIAVIFCVSSRTENHPQSFQQRKQPWRRRKLLIGDTVADKNNANINPNEAKDDVEMNIL